MSEQNAQTGVPGALTPRTANVFYFVLTILVFAVLGPPIGWTLWFTTWLFNLFVSALTRGVSGEFVAYYPIIWITGALMSYAYGVLFALLAGFLVATGKVLFESFGFVHALIIGVIVGALIVVKPAILSYAFLMPLNNRHINAAMPNVWGWAALSVLTTVACWYLTRPLRIQRSPVP